MANSVSPQASQFLPAVAENESSKIPNIENYQVQPVGVPGTMITGGPPRPSPYSMSTRPNGFYGPRPAVPPTYSSPKILPPQVGSIYQNTATSTGLVGNSPNVQRLPNSVGLPSGSEVGLASHQTYGVARPAEAPLMNGPNPSPPSVLQVPATNGVPTSTPNHSSGQSVGMPFLRQGQPRATLPSHDSPSFPYGPRVLGSQLAAPGWSRQPPPTSNSLSVTRPNDYFPVASSTGSSVAPSPATSEPPSAKSSRNPSPVSSQRYDAMEGQFALSPNISSDRVVSTATNNSNQMTQSERFTLPQPALGSQTLSQQTSLTPMTAGGPSISPLPPSSFQAAQLPPPQFASQPFPSPGGSRVPGVLPPLLSTNRFQPPSMQQSVNRPPPPQLQPAAPQFLHQGSPYSQPSAPPINAAVRPPPSTVPNTAAYSASALPQKQRQYQYPPAGAGGQQPPTIQGLPAGMSGAPINAEQPHWQKPQHLTSPPTRQLQQPGNTSHLSSSNGVDQLGNLLGPINLQGRDQVDLLQLRHILPEVPVEPPKIILPSYDPKTSNCGPEIFRCTLTKIPESQSVLQKSRLPLGILIHPFKDLIQLPVVQCNVIVRCRTCRTYINPFVQFLDERRWKCNLCFRVNELHEEFQYDPISKTYGDPTRRPEIKSATIEFIAPSEYMLRPPQPAVYLFILDVSYAAVETGYLRCFCETLLEELEKLPGDSRTRVGFMTYDNALHFYNLAEGLSQPQMMVVSDIEDVFLPCPDNLLVNLNENMELVKDLLQQLPIQFLENRTPDSALGAALQAAFKLVSPTGGRITVVQGSLPNVGPGALKAREDPNLRAGKEVHNLGPANDFYKKLSLDCSGHQVSVDLFIISSQYCDIATLSCISKFSGGSTHYYPGFHAQLQPSLANKFEHDLRRYVTRKIGFEAVMRIRCTKGLSIHTFHGNFFVRSTDLLSLPNVNPDAGYGMQMSIEEPLVDSSTACFQAALLYTSSKGERRIRVHTLCLPVTTSVSDIMYSADQQAIVGLLTKMAVDRSLSSSISDARDALINACVDAISAFKLVNGGGSRSGLTVPVSLKLLPLYVLAILKHVAFRLGTSTKLDERVFAMNQMKTLPLTYLMTYIYPNMYAVHNLETVNFVNVNDFRVPQPSLLNLSAERFERQGVFLLDAGDRMFLYICQGVTEQYCQNVFNAKSFDAIPERMTELPELESGESECLRNFVNHLQSQRPFHATLQVLKNTSKNKSEFLQHLIEDRTESAYSYYEFLKHLQQLMSK